MRGCGGREWKLGRSVARERGRSVASEGKGGGNVHDSSPFSPLLSLTHIHSFSSLFQTVVKRLNCLRVRSTASSSG